MQHVDEKALFKYLNLGCEMIFILDQRLRDAKISDVKKEKVMNTIWERFVSDEEFYRINENDYKSQFSRIAQCSIMKLNDTSMSKLYDLMLMAVKYQCFHAHHPNELYLILVNHFVGVYDIYLDSSSESARVVKLFFHESIKPFYTKFTTHRWLRLRRRILNDYQNARIRISMFLRNKVQTEDSAFKLFPNNRLSQEFSNPGKSVSHHNTTEWKPASQIMLTTKQSENSLEFDQKRTFQYGANIYKKPETLTDGGEKQMQNTDKESFLKTEVKLMSSMLGYEEIELDNDDITFSILNGEKLTDAKKITKNSTCDAKFTTVTATASDKNVKHLVNELKTFQVTPSQDEHDDDLLSMMDAI